MQRYEKVPYTLLYIPKIIIKKGQKIAQCVIANVEYVKTVEIEEISKDTSRGSCGFGSSGLGKNKKIECFNIKGNLQE